MVAGGKKKKMVQGMTQPPLQEVKKLIHLVLFLL